MADYQLTDLAVQDLDDLFDYGVRTFGVEQAIRFQYQIHAQFDLLADFPGIAGPADPSFDRPVHRTSFSNYYIYFETTDFGISILGVRHAAARDPARRLR